MMSFPAQGESLGRVSVEGSLSGGLCMGLGVSVQGVSVQGVSVQGNTPPSTVKSGLSDEPVGCLNGIGEFSDGGTYLTHPTGMHSCVNVIVLVKKYDWSFSLTRNE